MNVLLLSPQLVACLEYAGHPVGVFVYPLHLIHRIRLSDGDHTSLTFLVSRCPVDVFAKRSRFNLRGRNHNLSVLGS